MRGKRNHHHDYGSTAEMAAVAEGTHHGSSPGIPVVAGDRSLLVGEEGRFLGVVEVEDKVEIHILEVGMVGSTLQPNQPTDLNMILYDPNKDSQHLSHDLVKLKKIYGSTTKFNEEIRSKESGLCLVGYRIRG